MGLTLELDKELFLTNVYKEMDSHEMSVASDPELSLTLEKVLLKSNDFQLRAFFSRLFEKYYKSHNLLITLICFLALKICLRINSPVTYARLYSRWLPTL